MPTRISRATCAGMPVTDPAVRGWLAHTHITACGEKGRAGSGGAMKADGIVPRPVIPWGVSRR